MIIAKKIVNRFFLFYSHPVKASFSAFIVYFLLAFVKGKPWITSGYPYFNYGADAFLHGQFHFWLVPPSLHDLVIVGDKIYGYWGPFPDLVFLPFVYVFGITFSDILLTILLASTNVFLFSNLLMEAQKKELFRLDSFQRAILVFVFAFGTVQITLAPLGAIWFTALILGLTCTLFCYYAAVKYSGNLAFFLAGLGIAAAFATRMNLITVGIWPAFYLISRHWKKPKSELIRMCLIGLIPLLIITASMAYYNDSRFGSVFDNGLKLHNMSDLLREDFERYGLFHIHFLARNFFYQFMSYPFLSDSPLQFFQGGSLFLLTPIFFFVFNKKQMKKRDSFILWITLIISNIPILLYFNTGFVQMGPRFSMDYLAPLFLLTATGLQPMRRLVLFLLAFISVFHYFIGYFILAIFGS